MKITFSPREKTALLLVAALFLALGSYYLILTPVSRNTARLQAAVDQKTGLVQQNRLAFLRYRAESPHRQSLDAAYRKATIAVPPAQNLPSFLDDLNAYAAATGVQIQSFVPASSLRPSPGYTVYPGTLTFNASITQTVAFLRDLESSPRLVGIQEAQFTSQSSSDVVTVQFHLYAKG